MNTVTPDNLASMEFVLKWEKNGIKHEDRHYAHRVNFWRDILPPKIGDEIMGASVGDRITKTFEPGEIIAPPVARAIHPVPLRNINGRLSDGSAYRPRYGRFYPRGILKGVTGVFRDNIEPFRCTAVADDWIEADFNHPLAGLDLKIKVRIDDVREKFEEHGGTLHDWGEEITTGPGMQARCNGQPTDFFPSEAFARDGYPDAVQLPAVGMPDMGGMDMGGFDW